MKPFNLEKCIAGEKVVTRDGREFKFGAYNKDANKGCRVIGWVGELVVTISDTGKFWENGDEHALDLFMAEPVLYYAIKKSECNSTRFTISGLHYSEAELRFYNDNADIIEIRTFEPK